MKWGDIEQFSMFFLNKTNDLNQMAPILQTNQNGATVNKDKFCSFDGNN